MLSGPLGFVRGELGKMSSLPVARVSNRSVLCTSMTKAWDKTVVQALYVKVI